MKENKYEEYDRIAREVFLPMYPIISKEALELYGRTDGRCLDIGAGGGLFGYFVALNSHLFVDFLDNDSSALEVCRQRGVDWGLDDRCSYILSDVHNMAELESNTYDLIISRGSMPFWGTGTELVQAFCEIRRVLAPGGIAVIGGSLGPERMKAAICRKMREKTPNWQPPSNADGSCLSRYEQRSVFLQQNGIPNYAKVNANGHWIVLQK